MVSLRTLIRTTDDRTAALARLALGLVMFPHGAQKALGWFGGYGIEGTMGFLTGGVGLPAALAATVIAAEFLGALGLIVGLLGRAAAFGIASVMVGAVVTVHAKVGFFMNWSGQQQGEGFEFHLLALALALIVMVRGSGAWSLDRLLTRPVPVAAARAEVRLAA